MPERVKSKSIKDWIKNMNWKDIYRKRVMSAEQAIRLIHSGDRVVLGHAAAIPLAITDALAEHKDEYRDVEIVQLVPMGNARFADPEMEGHFRLNGIFLGSLTRQAVREGRADFTPCCFYEVP